MPKESLVNCVHVNKVLKKEFEKEKKEIWNLSLIILAVKSPHLPQQWLKNWQI